ncbi:MAG: VCBS repeat-containing protein [Bacteroidia bacterium]|nr:VCBS repeat-containing protein [Bacteroidia bacterium]
MLYKNADIYGSDAGATLINVGNGDGTFSPGQRFFESGDRLRLQNPDSVGVVDFDGDGDNDLVGNYNENLSVFLNSGGRFENNQRLVAQVSGVFNDFPNLTGSIILSSSSSNSKIIAVDINGDGLDDLLVSRSFLATDDYSYFTPTSDTISVLLNRGDTSFDLIAVKPLNFTPYEATESLNIVDINGDNFLDLIISSDNLADNRYNNYSDYDYIVNENTVTVLLNNSNNSFEDSITYRLGQTGNFLEIEDLDGDGNADLITTGRDSNDIIVFLNNGNDGNSFDNAIHYSVEGTPVDLAVGDLNDDGLIDVVTSINDDNGISVLLNSGNGALENPINYITQDRPSVLILQDFNSDSYLDLVNISTVNSLDDNSFFGDQYLSVLINRGDGSFFNPLATSTAFTLEQEAREGGLLGDFNKDGLIDLVRFNSQANNTTIFVNFGVDLGRFSSIATSTTFLGIGAASIQGNVDLIMMVT